MNSFRDVCIFISLLLYSVLTFSLAISHMDTRRFKGWSQIPRYGPEQETVVQRHVSRVSRNVWAMRRDPLSFYKLPKNNDPVSETKLFVNILFLFDTRRRTNYVDQMDPYGVYPRENFVELHDVCWSQIEQYWIHLLWVDTLSLLCGSGARVKAESRQLCPVVLNLRSIGVGSTCTFLSRCDVLPFGLGAIESCAFKIQTVEASGGILRSECGGTRWRTGGEVKGKLANGGGNQYSHTTSAGGISSITNADAHTSAASSRLNWLPRRFKWNRPFRRKTKCGFYACAIRFRTSSNCGSNL